MTIACLKCYLLTTPQGTVGYTRHIDVFRCIAAHNCTVGSLVRVAAPVVDCSWLPTGLLHVPPPSQQCHTPCSTGCLKYKYTNTQIHKYINTNATKNTMQLLMVAGYSTFRPFHRDKTLHAALNTVQLKQCVCSLFTEQCVCCRWQALHTFRQFMLYQQSLTC